MGNRRLFIALFCCFCLQHIIEAYHQQVFVDQSGHSNFTKIQKAIDSVPVNNRHWFFINVAAGLYREKIKIPYDKPFIVIVGAGKRNTRVEWDDHDSVAQSPTFATVADNTVIKSLTFVNTYNFPNKGKVNRNPRIPAVAALINGDKCAFYSVGFSGVQDTLWDADGRHFFHRCTIQGAVDFIFGNGQSIYKKCVINVLGATLKPGVAGYITAQGRINPYDASGFVFTDSLVYGSGKAFLGRPWRSYARVIFYNTDLTDVVVPQGWDSWHFRGHVSQLTFAEIGCYGSGSNTGRRVSWVKKLSGFSVQSLINLDFINSGGWVQALPIPV
ncbi:PREDICTED: probable pectinesterase 29 [Brassica oleracea var. oleracea]|uniref:Pectinesterase n=1 Tax=Brassica oleracea var. oleracea TaxID=109376 RepID=A0A0D3BCZ6_BRAOL|nr:PREDICTED: probable pectinesterase 29 [Brassica oleracea var. oleracea]